MRSPTEIAPTRRPWIALVSVLPLGGCELLAAHEGAYFNVVTLAASEAEYRTKLKAAMDHYRLEIQCIENVARAVEWTIYVAKLQSIVDELEQSRDEQHVRFCTWHKFPRRM